MKKENKFQAELIVEIEELFGRDVVILKNDPNYLQGILDLLVLTPNGWAMLEVKRSANEPYRPNQEYYIDLFDKWSFAAMICPENKEAILDDLQHALRPSRKTRVSQR